MKFKVDENLPVEAADLLREAGHEADTVQEEGLSGTEDEVLSSGYNWRAGPSSRWTWTSATSALTRRKTTLGIIILRPSRQDKDAALALIRRSCPCSPWRRWPGCIWIVEPDRIRIRRGNMHAMRQHQPQDPRRKVVGGPGAEEEQPGEDGDLLRHAPADAGH